MKIFVSIIFAMAFWIALYKVFFDDVEDFWKTAKENTFWFAVGLLFDTHWGGIRFLLWLASGVLGGALVGSLLYRLF